MGRRLLIVAVLVLAALPVAALDVPMPYALNLEDEVLPTEERVIDAVKRVAYAK